MSIVYKYILVDSDSTLSTISSSYNINCLFKEYLAIINNRLIFLIKTGAKANKLNFDNLFILKTAKHSKYPHPIYDKYSFDIKNLKFLSHKTIIEFNKPGYCEETLLNDIKNNLNTIFGKLIDVPLNEIPVKKSLENPTVTKKELYDTKLLESIIDELETNKQHEIKKMETIETIHKNAVDEYAVMANDLGDDKRELKQLREREEESWNIFESDKNIYKKMKQQIENGKLSENNIPELFSHKYPILKFLDEEQILDTEDDYFTFIEMYDEVYNKSKAEKNNQKKYYKSTKKYESLDKILAETYDDDDENEDPEDINMDQDNDEQVGSLLNHPMFK